MADRIGEVYIQITAQIDKLSGQLNDIKAKVESSARQAENTFAKTKLGFNTGPLMGQLAGLVTGFAAVALAKKSLHDFMEDERAANRLAGALRNAGVSAEYLAATQKEMQEFSMSVQKVTAYSHTTVDEIQAMYAAMTGLTGKAVRPLVWATLDLATGLGLDAQSAATLIAKSMEGSNSLSRYGIQLKGTETQTDKLNVITGKIQERFGNFAANELSTTAGKLKNLANVTELARENFGKFLAQGINPILPALAKMVDWIGKAILSVLLSLQIHFANMFMSGSATIMEFVENLQEIAPVLGVILKAMTGNAINPEVLKTGLDQFDKYLKGAYARGVELAEDAKRELLTINWTGPALPTTAAPQAVGRGWTKPIDQKSIDDIKKQRLDAEKELLAAVDRLQREQLANEYARERQAIVDKRDEDLKKLEMDKGDAQAAATMKLAIEAQYQADMFELTRKWTEKEAAQQEKQTKAWEVTHKHMAWIVQDTISVIGDEWGGALHSWISEGQSFGSATAHLWTNIANQVIEQIIRIGTQYAMLQGVLALANGMTGGFWGFVISMLGGAASSGTGGGGGGGGGSGMGGYTGQRIYAPAIPARPEGLNLAPITNRLDALNMNLATARRDRQSLAVAVYGQLEGEDIYFSNRKAGRTYSRSR